MTAPTLAATSGRTLVAPALFDRLTARIAAEHPKLAADMPARIVDQALAFLGTCAVTTRAIGPSDLVDIGWHTFILYTHEYAAFCDRIAGRFIHHQPDDAPGDGWPTLPDAGRVSLALTVKAIGAANYQLDSELWPTLNATSDCSQCHAGCHNSPTRR